MPPGNARVSVLMPVYRQAGFLTRALESLIAQTIDDWECVVIDDGSPDDAAQVVKPFLRDPRIVYLKLEPNCGLGAALNAGLDESSAPFVAYLPADDLYWCEHLEALTAVLETTPAAVLAYSGVRHHYNQECEGAPPGHCLQLVQVLHRRIRERWMEREQLVTDSLDRMYWNSLRHHGALAGTRAVTCEWVDHPRQRHKLIREPLGGLNAYRSWYSVNRPLHFHSTVGGGTDESALYSRFRSVAPRAGGGLKIVLVGELAYNPERVLAFEERGHKLFGLWMPEPHGYNSVGPLPFGHVEDIPRSGWEQTVKRIQPDLFYGLLNWQAVPWAHHVMTTAPDIPFVWHFKEGPFICLNRGTWPQLMDLYSLSDGQIYCSPEMRDWFRTVLPACFTPGRTHLVMDGDLPKREWFYAPLSPRLSDSHGDFHTVVPGRPIGLHPHIVQELADARIHLHFYGESTHSLWTEWIDKVGRLAPGYLHLHPTVDQRNWVTEFSRYDAGWLHFFSSANEGELERADWDDLNIPARIGPLVAAGLPLLQRDNSGCVVATQSLARELRIGIFFRDIGDLAMQLRNRSQMQEVRRQVMSCRHQFTFDHHCDRLIRFFRTVIAGKRHTAVAS